MSRKVEAIPTDLAREGSSVSLIAPKEEAEIAADWMTTRADCRKYPALQRQALLLGTHQLATSAYLPSPGLCFCAQEVKGPHQNNVKKLPDNHKNPLLCEDKRHSSQAGWQTRGESSPHFQTQLDSLHLVSFSFVTSSSLLLSAPPAHDAISDDEIKLNLAVSFNNVESIAWGCFTFESRKLLQKQETHRENR